MLLVVSSGHNLEDPLKNKFTLLLLILCSPVHALLNSSFVDFGTYLRSGIGSSGKGGDEVCFNNPGAAGNEFRLGNECTTYGELVINSFVKRGTSDY